MTAATTRTFEGESLPAVGVWTIDPTHSSVEFSIRHLGFSKVRGRFAAFTGCVVVDEDPLRSSVEVEIEIASVDTNLEKRDDHLRSSDFFEIESFPHATFRSTGVQKSGSSWQVTGELSVRGVTKEVVLDATLEGMAFDRQNRSRAGFSAVTKVNREDFGLTWNQPLEAGGFFLGDEVRLEIEVELVLNDDLESNPHYAIPPVYPTTSELAGDSPTTE